MKFRFAIALLGLAMLCASAVAQEMTAEDWSKRGEDELFNNSTFEALCRLLTRPSIWILRTLPSGCTKHRCTSSWATETWQSEPMKKP